MKVFFDMDGVLADFDGWLRSVGINDDAGPFIHKPRSEWTEKQHEIDAKVTEVMREPGFFYNLKPMPGYLELWESIPATSRYILTARPKDRPNAPKFDPVVVYNDKLNWLKEHLPDFREDHFYCVEREQKKEYARSHFGYWRRLLVDDMAANCNEWKAAGGIAIHYQNANQAITEIKKIYG